jgi:hypothetical protein
VRRLLFGLLYQPQMMDDDGCRACGDMEIDRGRQSTRRKPAPMSLRPKIPQYVTKDRSKAAEVGSRRLDAWTLARPLATLLILGYLVAH